MGKKKSSGKMSRMSEEERYVYQEEQRHREAEIQKKKEDMLTQFMKDKLVKEERFSRMNAAKLDYNWRMLLRLLKAKELRKECEIIEQVFEREADSKDCELKSLVKNLLEAEEQHALARRSHFIMVDKLVDHHRRYLQALQEGYRGERDAVVAEFEAERAIIDDQHARETQDIADIMVTMEQRSAERADDELIEFNNNRDEIKNKHLEEKHSLRIQMEGLVNRLWEQFESALAEYKSSTHEKGEMFKKSKTKDEKDAAEIALNMRRIYRLQTQISRVRSCIESSNSDVGKQNKLLKQELSGMQAQYHCLKKQMVDNRKYESDRMIKMTVESANALKQLKQKVEKGERVLRLAEICRKYETEEEKVVPFYACSLTQDEQDLVNEATLVETPREKLAEVIRQYAPLENFWKRYNKVLLDKLALEKEKQTLMGEGYRLRTLLKQYLDGISVNDEIMSNVNPLFILNYQAQPGLTRVPVGDKRIKRQAQVTVTEAAHTHAYSASRSDQ